VTAVVEPVVRRQRGPLLAVLVANVLSICGTTMTYLAVPWFVLETTGSPVRTGVVLGVEIGGTVVASVLGGPVVDRLGHKRSSVLSDLLAAVAVVAVPVLHFTAGLPFWALLGLVGALGLSRAPGETARGAMLPTLIEMAGTTTHRAMSAYEGVSRTAKALGAPLAGVLIVVAGAPSLLFVDGATFLISAVLVWIFVTDRSGGRAPAHTYLAALRTGFDYLRRDRLMGAIVAMVTLTNALDMAALAVLYPIYAKDILHSSVALGLIAGTFAAGAVLGNTVYGWIGHRLPNWGTYTVAFLVVGSPRYFLLAAEPGLPVILIWMLVIGVFCGTVNPVLGVVEVRRLPAELRAKVLGLIAGGANAAAPLGAVLGGVAVAAFGLTPTLLLVGVVYLLATLCPLVFPTWREMDAD
jgi:predicted MFS family arabinose efflux permease